ncbi:GNAT family N-acetyltransferase [Sphingomonas sp.]|uniref:GNAT family N-acetyltransferase n=1 Tax=Sphingomonas sp. TaxID=28214 RepID=UPI0025F13EDD|nr:GNAT family N-acetyltransferase [Sphingomonas sp.]
MSDGWRIVEDPATGPEITALIAYHLAQMHAQSPPENVFALGLEALRAPGVTLWTAWEGQALLGCAALKLLGPGEGEIKSMRTAPDHLRRGVAAHLLAHLVAAAQARGLGRLYLETGSGPGFAAAHALYLRHGFAFCGPFADYAENAFSRFMARTIT